MRKWAILGLLLLAACGKGKGGAPGDVPPEPPEAAADFRQPLDARGLDPAFGLKVRNGTTITLTRPGEPDVTVTAPGAVIQPDQASWSGPMPDGQILKVVFYSSRCLESTNGVTYSFSVEVDLPNATPMGGCGGKPVKPKG